MDNQKDRPHLCVLDPFERISVMNERDSDGLVGLKMLDVVLADHNVDTSLFEEKLTGIPRTVLRSPHHHVEWGNTLTAKDWSNSKGVRGEGGIHACWPSSLDELLTYHFDEGSALVELRGFGDTVQGELGWRSQHAMLKKIWVHEKHISALKQTYEADVAHLDAWITQFFLTLHVSESCSPVLLKEFLTEHLYYVRPSFLREIYLNYRGPHSKLVRDSAFKRYNALQSDKVLCELEL